MVGYKLSKNDWVTPFFVIFRSVREKLLVTVSFDHPVLGGGVSMCLKGHSGEYGNGAKLVGKMSKSVMQLISIHF